MKNYVQRGDTVTLTAPYALASGEGFAVGTIYAVAEAAAANGASVEGRRVGVFTLPKATGTAWGQGDKLYWDSAAKNLTKTVGSNLFVGAALKAAASGDATGTVLLPGTPT